MVFSRIKVALLATSAISCVVFQALGRNHLFWAAASAWLVLVFTLDRPSARRMGRPKFWIISSLVAIASGMVLGRHDVKILGLAFSMSGIEAGLSMSFRAAFIFSLFSLISSRIKMETFQSMVSKLGMKRLGIAVSSAFSILPYLKLAVEQRHSNGRRLWSRFTDILARTAEFAEAMSSGHPVEPIIVAVISNPKQGKTTLLIDAAEELKKKGITVGGIVQPRILGPDGNTVGYKAMDVLARNEVILAQRLVEPAAGELGYEFDDDSWTWARDRIEKARLLCDVLVVDELGLLESNGGGHMPALKASLPVEVSKVWLAGVRQDTRDAIRARVGGFDREVSLPVPGGAKALADIVCSLVPGKGTTHG